MIIYTVSGLLSERVEWEDFISKTHPNVMIEIVPENAGRFSRADDEWFDAYVSELTEESAKAILAEINGVPVDQIEIVQKGVCVSA